MTDPNEHPAKIRILVLDEQPLLRYGISTYLNSQPDMGVCGEADSVEGAVSKIAECQPQLVVTELRLGAGDGLKLVKKVKAEDRTLRILVYSAFEESIFAERAMRDIVKVGIYVSREVALSGFRKSLQNNHAPRSANTLESLSDREMHIFELLGSGLGTRQIAQSLDLSVKTIESHRENIKHKLRLTSGTQLHERAAKWVERASGIRKSGKVRLHAVVAGVGDPGERKSEESEDIPESAGAELIKQHKSLT